MCSVICLYVSIVGKKKINTQLNISQPQKEQILIMYVMIWMNPEREVSKTQKRNNLAIPFTRDTLKRHIHRATSKADGTHPLQGSSQMETYKKPTRDRKAESFCGAQSQLLYLQHDSYTQGSGVISEDREGRFWGARGTGSLIYDCVSKNIREVTLKSHPHDCLNKT